MNKKLMFLNWLALPYYCNLTLELRGDDTNNWWRISWSWEKTKLGLLDSDDEKVVVEEGFFFFVALIQKLDFVAKSR